MTERGHLSELREVVHHTVEFDTTDEEKLLKLIAYAKRLGIEHYLRDHHIETVGSRG